MNSEELKKKIILAGRKAVEQLIKVAREDIIKPDPEDELDILNKIDLEEENIGLSNNINTQVDTKQGFAERRSK